MSLHLTAEDTRRLASVSEALLSPLAGPSPEAWCLEVERRVRALLPGANVAFWVADAGGVRIHSASVAPDRVRVLRAYAAVDPRRGHGTMPRAPEVDAWLRWRRAHVREVHGEAEGRAVYRRLGFDAARSAWFAEGLHPAGLHDFAGLFTEVPGRGELFLNVGYARPGRSRRGHDADLALLGLLLPAYRAAHHALAAFAPRLAALAAAVDAGPDARVLHRSAALERLLNTEPERERLLARMEGAAAACRALRTSRGAGLPAAPDASGVVVTAFARYAVRVAFAPAYLWGAEGVVQVAAERQSALEAAPDAAPAPAPPGLTAREAQVAGLLARRATDAEVAATLGVSWHTARRHAERVLRKLGVRSRTQVAVALAEAAPR
jgi:DNA-binding CsgD family transcriptional regulator